MRAAFYECDITPPLGGFLWGHYFPVFARKVHEKIYAKALVVEQEGELTAILEIDACKLPEEAHDIIARRIYEYTGISPERVCIACNHTHAGAPINDGPEINCKADVNYTDVCFRLCADAVTLAYQRLEEAEAAFGTEQLPGIAFCRNYELTDGRLITHGRGNPDAKRMLGNADDEVAVLLFETAGKPLGAMINFACHQCCMDGYDSDPGYIGDYSSILSKKLKEQYGDDFVSLFILGACGDINTANPDTSVPRKPADFDGPRYHWIGTQLAEATMGAVMGAMPVSGSIGVVKQLIEIPRREPSDRDSALATTPGRLRNLLHYAGSIHPQSSLLAVQVIRIGDVGIYCMPGELYSAYGHALKAQSPFAQNMVIENCNYYTGYIPTPECFGEKSELYEASLCFHSNLAPESGERITSKALELARELIQK